MTRHEMAVDGMAVDGMAAQVGVAGYADRTQIVRSRLGSWLGSAASGKSKRRK